MDISDANELISKLMREHELTHWVFSWSSARSFAGLCHEKEKRLVFSRPFALHVSDDELRNTVLHEIAHALVGSRHKHDALWRACHVRIGGDGARSHEMSDSLRDAYAKTSRYVAICTSCGEKFFAQRNSKNLTKKYCGKSACYHRDDAEPLLWIDMQSGKPVSRAS